MPPAAGSAIGALGFGSYAPLSAAAAGASASAAADREVEAFDAFVRKLHRRAPRFAKEMTRTLLLRGLLLPACRAGWEECRRG